MTLYHWNRGGGRESTEKDVWRKPHAERQVVREVCSVVQGIPHDEAVLIFVHRPRGRVDVRALLERGLLDLGVDLSAKLPDGHQRICLRTYGSETATNEFSPPTRT